ncbi:MAG: hypothetical protein IJX47_06045 [Clostridia bacterium]|nr:hypothetical protein [Clostridia bacterium]
MNYALTFIRSLEANQYKFSGEKVLKFFSNPEVIAIYLAVVLLLVALLASAILVSLHLVRKSTDRLPEDINDLLSEARDIQKNQQPKQSIGNSRFPQLAKIDEELHFVQPMAYASCPLDELCERFRNFAAGNLGLYYDIADIRRFIAGMGISKLVILRGISGTGKTSLAYAAGEFFGNSSTVVPIQPMWKERSDMIGYFNEFTKKFNETTMLCKLYEAGGRADVYITVLDEVNISRIEYYFAEFLSLLELPDASKRYVDVVADSWKNDPERIQNGKLLLPENMWFIGTANNDDSTFAISDKVYDRAAVIDLERKCAPFPCESSSACHISYWQLTQLFEQAKKAYALSDESRRKLARLDAYMSDVFRVSFGNRIMKQIEAYIPIMIACGGSEAEALDDLLARKILRKLEQLSPAFVKNESDGLLALLDELFGIKTLRQSREYIDKLRKGY